MAVSLRPKFTQKEVRALVLKQKERLEDAIVMRLMRIGEQAIVIARTKTPSQGSFIDRTGNLRNSMGYVVLRNGVQLKANFRRSAVTVSGKTGKEKLTRGAAEGLEKGRQVADEVAAQFPTGFVLIIVAGMEYAAAVEARGKDVITGSSLQATNLLKRAIQELQSKLEKKIA